ncbi:MAG: DUF502 domain-containing protein [Dehalococcoidia bacterium]|nr:DUF502 domain-containing protein [Dehalococcoidia bacterium]
MMRGTFNRQAFDESERPHPEGPRRPERRVRRMPLTIIRHLERRMMAGVLVFLPIFVTYFIFAFFYDFIASLLDPIISWLSIPHGEGFDWADVVEIAVILVVVYIAGVLIGWAVTKLLINWVHDQIGRIPVIGPVYNTTRVGIDFLSDTQEQQFRGVVMLEFPRLGVLSIGLITSNLGKLDGVEDYLSIYVPTTPVPSSGYLCIAPYSQVTATDISVDEAMRMIISGGILAGDVFTARALHLPIKEDAPQNLHWLWGSDSAPSTVSTPTPPTRDQELIPAAAEIQD